MIATPAGAPKMISMQLQAAAARATRRAARACATISGAAGLIAGLLWLLGHRFTSIGGSDFLPMSTSLAWFLVVLGAGGLVFAAWPAEVRNLQLAQRERDLLSQRLALLMDSLDDVVMLSDSQSRIVEVNRRAEAVYGYSVAELLQMRLPELRAPECRAAFASDRARHEAEDSVVFQTLHERKDGSHFPVEISSRRVEIGGERFRLGVLRDITGRRRAEAALLNSERSYHEIFNATTEAIFVHDARTGQLLDVNEPMLKMYGYAAREEVLKRSAAELSANDSPFTEQKAHDHLAKAVAEGPQVFEWHARRQSGDLFWVEVSLRATHIGGEDRVLAVVRDITLRKQAEAERNRLVAILERTPDFVEVSDLQGQTLYLNATGRRLCNGGASASVAQRHSSELYPAWASERVREEGLPAARANGLWVGETALLTGTGIELPVSQVIIAHKDERGEVTHYSTIMRDLSERKRLEQALRQNEERLRTIIEHSNQLHYAHTPEHVLTYVSPQSREIFDCEPEEALVRWTEFVTDHPVNAEGFKHTEEAIRTGQRQPPYELELATARGRKLWVEVDESPVVLRGKVVAIVGALTDITTRKRFEQVVQCLTRLGRGLGVASAADPAAQALSDAAQELLGWDACFLEVRSPDLRRAQFVLNFDTIQGCRVAVPAVAQDAITPIERIVMEQGPQLVLREPETKAMFVPFGDKDRPSLSLLYVPLRHQGRYLGMFSVQSYTPRAYDPGALDLLQTLADHTAGALERLRTEQALRVSEVAYRRLHETMRDAFVQTDMEGRIHDSNRTFQEMVGYSGEELRQTTYQALTPPRWHNSERRLVQEQILPHGHSEVYEKEYVRKDGTVFPVELHTFLLRDEAGEPHGMWAIVRDITERKRAEAALQESEQKFRNIVQSSPLGMHMYALTSDERLVFTGCNPAAEKMLAVAHEPFVGKEILEAFPGLQKTEIPQRYRRAALEGEPWQSSLVEYQDQRLKGAFEVFVFQTAPRQIAVMFQEITARKEAEEALRASQRFLAKAQEVTRLGCYDFDVATGQWFATRMLEEVFGLPSTYPRTVDGWLQLIHPEDREGMRSHLMGHVLRTGQRFEKEYRIVRPADGQVRWVAGMGELEFDTAHRPVRMIGTIQDITDRKATEERQRQLAAANEQLLKNLQLHFNSMPVGCIVTLPNVTVMDWNPAAQRIFGFSRAEMLGQRPLHRIFPPATRKAMEQFIAGLLEASDTRTARYKNLTRDGRTIVCDWHGTPLRDDVGRVVGVLAMVQDITERLRAEAALRESERRLSTMIANLPSGFAYQCANDRDWTMRFITDGVRALTGCTPEDFTSGKQHWNDLIHPADRERVWHEIQAALSARSPYQLEYRLQVADEVERWVWEQGAGVFNSEGEVEALEGMVVDISARKHAEAAAREFSGRLLAAQDEERRRLARELHDTTAQTIAALCMNLTMLGAKLPPADPAATQLLADAAGLGERAGQEIRTIAYLLHPPILEHVGLAGAIREFAAGFGRRSGIAVSVEIAPGVTRHSPEIELALLRIVQESLGNVHRHSGSPTAIIRLRQAAGEIVLDVADVGRGFPVTGAGRSEAGQIGVGIAGMRERLRHLGGHLEISSGPGGTILRAILPSPPPTEPGEN